LSYDLFSAMGQPSCCYYVDDVADHLRDEGVSAEAEVLVGPPAEAN